MAVYTKEFLSGSTNGRPIKVTATGSPGDTIHTAHATSKDEVHIWAVNVDTVERQLTIQKGGTTAPDDNIIVKLPSKAGLLLVLPGTVLSNSLVTKAFADAANVILLDGYVNRVT